MAEMLKWKPGFGPVLKPKDLYLLEADLEIHPILAQKYDPFRLECNLMTGRCVGIKGGDRDLAFTMKDESATLPRVTELMIILRAKTAPWCTIVRNEKGVTLADVCGTLWKEYTENPLTEAEFNLLNPRDKDKVQRLALRRESDGFASGLSGMWGVGNAVGYARCRRIDCLFGKVYFDGLERDDDLAKEKLRFVAPNVFVLRVSE
ncbi:uncharacterized protein FOMMEDRAFT_130419 [Fomitiporia mediterranea MF3/22]|uniref:DUF6699 domain-containing protein n=1 Tax=Fomitiporia mediterranea (strain MF3/22) TaxID=694068 RepID=R7SFS8_FOMME|nr:uncharacterized protein FOMMEDRAFT_130419 [Fomitiporia mediterranea MF3/22]EJC97581.1 hypothetical protein FOMMEDRAFT_130419 [Fomitiporia mediterranea MF3/22]